MAKNHKTNVRKKQRKNVGGDSTCLSLTVLCEPLGINKLLSMKISKIPMMLWYVSFYNVYPNLFNSIHFFLLY